MPVRRPHRVAVTAGTALALLLGSAPFAGVAQAAVPEVVPFVFPPAPGQVTGELRVLGPYAGFPADNNVVENSVDRGVNGHTPLAVVTVAPGVKINSVEIHLDTIGHNINLGADFNEQDSFQLFKDADDDSRFRAADYFAVDGSPRPVSTHYDNPTTAFSYNKIVVYGGANAVGGRFFLTARPRVPVDRTRADRTFHSTIPSNGVQTTAGSFPASDLDLLPIKIDTKPPTLANGTAGQLTASCGDVTITDAAGRSVPGTEDYYTKQAAMDALVDLEYAAFFNTATGTAKGNLLTRPVTETDLRGLAVWPRTTTTMKIGDGSGRTVLGTVAVNNQLGDTVFLRGIDHIGNPTDAMELGGTACTTKGNDVTAPTYAAYTLAVPAQITTANSGAGGSTVPVTGTLSAPIGLTSSSKQYVRLMEQGNETNTTAFSSSTCSLTASGACSTNAALTPALRGDGTRVIAEAYLVDADVTGNKTALVRTTAAGVVDVSVPSITKIGVIEDTTPSGPSPGDRYRVEFSEPLDQSTIDDTDGVREQCDPKNTLLPGATNCVNKRILLRDLAITSNTGTEPQERLFGTDPGFDWSGDGQSAIVTLGLAPTVQSCPGSNSCAAMVDPATDSAVLEVNVKDLAGNQAVALTSTNPAPVWVRFSAFGLLPTTLDTVDDNSGSVKFNMGRDGYLDSILVTFSGSISGVANSQGSFKVTSGSDTLTPTVSPVGGNGVKLAFGTQIDPLKKALWTSGARPIVSLVKNSTVNCDGTAPPGEVLKCTGLESSPGGPDVDPFAKAAADKAGPAVLSVTTGDADADGLLDRLVVQYSESVRSGTTLEENPCGYKVISPAGITADHYNTTRTTPGECGLGAPDNVKALAAPGADASQTFLTLREFTSIDTDKLPTVEFDEVDETVPPGSANKPVRDASGNALAAWTNNGFPDPTRDGAGPAVTEFQTADVDGDGLLDAIDVKYTEFFASNTRGQGTFTITAPVHTVIDRRGLPDGLTLRLHIDESTAPGTGDTGSPGPTVAYSHGADEGIRDTSGALGPPKAATVAVDKAPPAIIGASFSFTGVAGHTGPGTGVPADDGYKMLVKFSEALAAGEPAKEKFEVTQGTRTVVPTGVAAATATQCTVVAACKILSFSTADPKFDLFAGGTIRLVGAGAVSDAASPANASTQVAAVPYGGYPTARLNLTGPAGSNAGYSTSRTFNTGAGGNSAVVGWFLVIQSGDSPPPTAPAASDSNWVSVQPTTAQVQTDGVYDGYLWTKDAVGNVTHVDSQATGSPVAEDTIEVAATAPTIQNVSYVNLRGNATRLRDGDTLRVKADAYGPDAAKWASNGACLPQYMSVDYRSVSGNASKGQVGPTACDLKPGSPPHRAMEFPFIAVNGTTHYPVGTVLKTGGSTDPGWILEDGATGIVKRKFYSITARRTWMVKDSQVITVAPGVISRYPTGAVKSYRDGALVRASGSPDIWVIDDGKKRNVPSNYFSYYRYTGSMVNVVPAAELNAMPRYTNVSGTRHVPGTYIRYVKAGQPTLYYVILRAPNGALFRRGVTSTTALATLVPSSQIVPASSGDMALPLDSYIRGYRDGTMLKAGSTFYVISRGRARQFAGASIFNALGYVTANAIPYVASAIGHVRNQAATLGVQINFTNRSITIRVSNVAGLTATKTILLQGVGTFETPPAALPTNVPKRP